MTSKVKEAIEILREMPEREQETLADVILEYASRDADLQLSDEQVAEVRHRRAKKNRKYLTLQQLDKRLRKLGA